MLKVFLVDFNSFWAKMNSTSINSTIVINYVVCWWIESNKCRVSLNANTNNLLISYNFVSTGKKLLNNESLKSTLFGGVLDRFDINLLQFSNFMNTFWELIEFFLTCFNIFTKKYFCIKLKVSFLPKKPMECDLNCIDLEH